MGGGESVKNGKGKNSTNWNVKSFKKFRQAEEK
jgi:hypothetical protein